MPTKAIAPPITARAARDAADLLKMASDATRLQILVMLAEAEMNVTQICAELGVSTQPAVSHHLILLKAARLVTPRRDGKNNYYGLTDAGRSLAGVVAGVAAKGGD